MAKDRLEQLLYARKGPDNLRRARALLKAQSIRTSSDITAFIGEATDKRDSRIRNHLGYIMENVGIPSEFTH